MQLWTFVNVVRVAGTKCWYFVALEPLRLINTSYLRQYQSECIRFVVHPRIYRYRFGIVDSIAISKYFELNYWKCCISAHECWLSHAFHIEINNIYLTIIATTILYITRWWMAFTLSENAEWSAETHTHTYASSPYGTTALPKTTMSMTIIVKIDGPFEVNYCRDVPLWHSNSVLFVDSIFAEHAILVLETIRANIWLRTQSSSRGCLSCTWVLSKCHRGGLSTKATSSSCGWQTPERIDATLSLSLFEYRSTDSRCWAERISTPNDRKQPSAERSIMKRQKPPESKQLEEANYDSNYQRPLAAWLRLTTIIGEWLGTKFVCVRKNEVNKKCSHWLSKAPTGIICSNEWAST